MKRKILFATLIGATGLITIIGIGNFFPRHNKEYYQPRKSFMKSNDAKGAINWLHRIRANQHTGEIDLEDVLAARQQLEQLRIKKKSSATTFEWEEMGPDNIGGRTRAILFDMNDPNIIYAGGVSGGLFRSPNGGRSWVKVNDQQGNLAIVSICRAVDGTVYYGTGEGMYYNTTGTGTGGIVGGGIFKSTNTSGTNFQLIASTKPTSANSNWASVGKLVADPNDANTIYAATNRGLRKTTDGGTNWTTPSINIRVNGIPVSVSNSRTTDMTITPSGTIWAKVASYIFKSTDGNDFVEITSAISGPDVIQRNGGRMRIAVSPQDENYVYVTSTGLGGPNPSGDFAKAYQSTDGGQTWKVIGSKNAFLNPHNGQGNYNHALAVSPIDKERIFVGGVTLWEWSKANGWLQLSSLVYSPGSRAYVHADNHAIVFHPKNPQTILVGNDGGIFKSTDNGSTWGWEVKNYITTQFYNIGVGLRGDVMGGTQDNGTIYINPGRSPNTPNKRGIITARINYRDAIMDGDGGYASLSKLDTFVQFKEMQYGIMGRSIDNGNSFSEFFDFERMDPNNISAEGRSDFADFVAPFLLWEKLNDPSSRDSIYFKADSAFISMGFGNGSTTYSGALKRPQLSSIYLIDGLKITAGSQVLTSDASGNLTGDGKGTFDPVTGNFKITFNDPVTLEIRAKCGVQYLASSVIEVSSNTNNIPISYVLPTDLNPNDSIRIQDPVQSIFFVGLRSSSIIGTTNERGGIWMTRDILRNKTATPVWYHIGELGNGITPQCMAVSDDGDMLYVGTSRGRVYRFSNLNAARDSASTDVDDLYDDRKALVRGSTSVIQSSLVRTFNGRAITSISIHPNDKNKAIITIGNYGNNNYVYYSSNAASSTPVFITVQGNLPQFPVYSSTFNFTDLNQTQILIGTDAGVFVTGDVTASPISWEQQNNEMANVPVFCMIQQKTIRYDLKGPGDYEGSIYIGTHGRGIFKSNSSRVPVGINENEVAGKEEKPPEDMLDIFPNPAINSVNVGLQLDGKYDVTISVRDISGKMLKSVNYDKVDRDITELPLNVSYLGTGTYIITLKYGKTIKTGKLIKR